MGKQPSDVDPICLSFIVCEKLIHDAITNQRSVVGIVSQLHGTKFPIITAPLWLFGEITSCHGQSVLNFEIVDVDDARPPVFSAEVVINIENPLAVSQFAFRTHPLTFPEPGDYRVRLICSNRYLLERRIILNLVAPPQSMGDNPSGTPEG